MLLSSVIIVLREVIEAALLFSILIALSKLMNFKSAWIILFLISGLISSVFYAMNIDIISEWFDGVGQEVVNASIQIIIYFMLLLYIIVLMQYYKKKSISMPVLISLLFIISIFAITREGSEIILYFYSVTHHDNHPFPVITGMGIGASIGISVGFLFYYLLVSMKQSWSINLGLILLILIGAGMISQASLLLIQADWLPAQLPLWDTSNLISEKSITGQLLYALIGYESTPTALQFGLYLFSLILPLLFILGFNKTVKETVKETVKKQL